MAGGNLIGSVFNTFAFTAVWVILGYAVDKLATVFNLSVNVLPTLQDAVTGFSMTEFIFGIVPVIAFFVIWTNYFLVEHSQSSGEL
jgi:type II secretory pathway component PulF